MHKDQKRVQSALLPILMDRVYGTDPASERDCTVMNRAFLQGPDPLFLMEVCPKEFHDLCENLGLDEAVGRDAIERAHWSGPGVLLPKGSTGIPVGAHQSDPIFDTTEAKCEALWLILASLSDTTEEDYQRDITLLERLQRVTRSAIRFASRIYTYNNCSRDPFYTALRALDTFNARAVFTTDDKGIPHTDVDEGFYLAYKAGHKIAAVRYGDKTFYGCAGGTTLDEHGVTVDVKVSEAYGFVRNTP